MSCPIHWTRSKSHRSSEVHSVETSVRRFARNVVHEARDGGIQLHLDRVRRRVPFEEPLEHLLAYGLRDVSIAARVEALATLLCVGVRGERDDGRRLASL
jgi:hypothetical protein